MTTPRVVSLVPSVTETLLALGCTPIACTRFCEQPSIRAVGGTKDPDVAAIVALRPDVVVMNDEENRRDDFATLEAAGLTVVAVSPRSVADAGAAVRTLAGIAGVEPPGPFAAWDAWVGAHVSATAARLAVTMVWRRPWMALGRDTYGASVLAALGYATPFADDRYPEVSLDQVRELRPAAVVLPSEPYPFAPRHVAEVAAGVPGAEVALVDGQDLLWWGIRTPDALTRLAAQLRPVG